MTNAPMDTGYMPRFAFDAKLAGTQAPPGTLNDLIAELDHEQFTSGSKGPDARANRDGKAITFNSLKRTLEFIAQVSGRSFGSVTQELSALDLKTIKLLYDTNLGSDTHLFRLLESPVLSGKPTLEFYASEDPIRNEKGAALVDLLLESLAKEIDSTVKRRVEVSFLTYSKLLEAIELETLEYVQEPVYTLHAGNSEAIKECFRRIAESIETYEGLELVSHVAARSMLRPLNEVFYTYLRSLPFLHFAAEYSNILDLSKIQQEIRQVSDGVEAICAEIGESLGKTVSSDGPVTSLTTFSAFVEEHVPAFISLIKKATGISTERRDILDNLNYSSKVLASYVFHQWGMVSQDEVNISVMDCLAALCAVRHQQKVKTKYRPYWVGQKEGDKPSRTLGHMDASKGIDELYKTDYIPHGVTQLMYARFGAFHTALGGGLDRHNAWMRLQKVRISKYAECYHSNDVTICDLAVVRFNEFCARVSMEAARSVA